MKLTMGEFRRLTVEVPDECPFYIAAWEDDAAEHEGDAIEIDRVDVEEDAACLPDEPGRWLFTLWVHVRMLYADEIQGVRQDIGFIVSQLERATGVLKNLG